MTLTPTDIAPRPSVVLPGPATEDVLGRIEGTAPYSTSAADLLPIQLAALDECFQQRRAQIRVLDQRARDVGVEKIRSLSDAVPLLFSHHTYKSYPESFVDKGQWAKLNTWLATLSTADVREVDVSDVSDVDSWLARLAEAGHFVRTSSGTSGKASFLNRNTVDMQWRHLYNVGGFLFQGVVPDGRYTTFGFGVDPAVSGPNDRAGFVGDVFGKSGATYYLSAQRESYAEISRFGKLRNAMIDGTITPEELTRFEKDSAARQEESARAMEHFVDLFIAHRDEAPLMFNGTWHILTQFIDAVRARGCPDGGFGPESVLSIGGGRKAAPLPDDYETRVRSFFEACRYVDLYGMTEINGPTASACSHGHLHFPAHLLPLVLDISGEQVLNTPHGHVVGRLALFDFSMDGRWGGVITSDEVDVDFSPCTCGLAGATIRVLRRYPAGEGGDDKLTCAGTIAAYVRGAIEN